MGKTLMVGDPHAQVGDLPDAEALMRFVAQTAKDRGVDKIEIFGDLFHTHNVIRLEVYKFWAHHLRELAQVAKTIVIAGNHDQPGDLESEWQMNALQMLENLHPNLHVVSSTLVDGDTLYVAHTSSKERFAQAISAKSTATRLACHQTFYGATYENGMYAPEGIDPGIVADFKQVDSGHIHKKQTFANIRYIGTPRWMSLSDANEDKGIYVGEEFISSADACTKIVSLTISEGDELPVLPKGAKVFVELVGPSRWISETSKKIKGQARVVPRPTDSGSVRAGRVATVARLDEYLAGQKLSDGVTAADVISYVQVL